MARRSKEPEPVEANLSIQEMEAAIPKIDRKLVKLRAFDIDSVSDRSNPAITALESELDTLLASIFGARTVEYHRYVDEVIRLDRAPMSMFRDLSIQEIREGLGKGFATSIAQLESIKGIFLEELEDAGHTATGKTLKAYQGLELHAEIERAAGNLFRDGHYANAVEDAVKALNDLVRMRSGEALDGTALMNKVFSPNNPVLKFNQLSDETGTNEQQGFMMMFSGAVIGLRNPRAHKIIKDEPEMALEFIAFISLLAKLVDKSTK